jgi:hypothetical protein
MNKKYKIIKRIDFGGSQAKHYLYSAISRHPKN